MFCFSNFTLFFKAPMWGLRWYANCIRKYGKFGNMIMKTKDRVIYPLISEGHSLSRVHKRILNTLQVLLFFSIPGYFIQGLSIWWWDHKARPWEGFNYPIRGLKLPVLMINIGPQRQSLATSHHFLRQKKRWHANDRTA